MQINDHQEKLLIKAYKAMILKKLGFSEKFPRNILYARKSTLSIGLIKHSIAISTLVLK